MRKVKRKRKTIRILGLTLAAALAVNAGVLAWIAIRSYPNLMSSDSPSVAESETEKESADQVKSMTMTAVGDNLIHDVIYYYQDATSGSYNFDPIYANTASYTQNSDLSYINMETLLAGESEDELSGYPCFNGPVEFLDAFKNAGFDWLALSSNHSLDIGAENLIWQQEYIRDNYPEFVWTGSNTSEEERNTPKVIDVNGIKVGIQGYTYGTNGIPVPEDKPWVIQVYRNDDGTVNYDMMREDLEALNAVSDIQIVSMHWGDEYVTEPTQEEQEIAQFLNEQGVEVIIGTHPHVIQPVEIIHGENQDTLCYYSLGNYVSAQNDNTRMVGGMASFTITYDPNTETAEFEDVKFIPTVTWYNSDYTSFTVYPLPDWNDSLASTHWVTVMDGQDLSKEWITEYVSSIVGDPDGIQVVME